MGRNSAYYNSPVSVEIIKNDRVGQTSIFEREVNLTCFGKVRSHFSLLAESLGLWAFPRNTRVVHARRRSAMPRAP